MDGFKKRLNESVQFKLSFSLSMAILVIAVVAGIFSFISAFDEAHELQDDMLRQIGALVDRQNLPNAPNGEDVRAQDIDEESRVIVQFQVSGSRVSTNGKSQASLPIPLSLSDGLHTLDVNGEQYRVLVKTTTSGARIAVAQETGVRDEIARDSAFRTLMPFLILVPVLLLIVADLVRKMFRPIAALSEEIDQRAEQEMHPVEENRLPVEVRPFAVAINRLLARVEQSITAQRRFVADAAHELRSPLTALSLQTDRLAEADMSELARERLITLRRGIMRGRNLLDQLLTLAKAQTALERPEMAVSVQHVFRHVLEELMPLAEAKHIDIGIDGMEDVLVRCDQSDMVAVVRNLVDNAIRYTPEGGRVDLAIANEERSAVLRIRDSGPGIHIGERERVFDPFYRTLGTDQVGSGLGLSIVKAIAQRMGAAVDLGFSEQAQHSGLCVCVRFPVAKTLQES